MALCLEVVALCQNIQASHIHKKIGTLDCQVACQEEEVVVCQKIGVERCFQIPRHRQDNHCH